MPMGEPEGVVCYGVVSLLDEEHEGRVLRLWEELEREFGLSFGATHIPHFSYHVAERYDLERLEGVLRRRAAARAPFQARSRMLGAIRTPEAPLFFLPLVRSQELTDLHRALWPELSDIATGIFDRYAPEVWMATVNLTPDIERDLSSELLRFLLARDLAWEIRIDNISLLRDTGTSQELAYRLRLGGGRTAPRSSP